jgi:hypothetical protein
MIPRMCKVGNEECLFHGFFEQDEPEFKNNEIVAYRRRIVALVEYDDGRVSQANSHNVIFFDKAVEAAKAVK